MDAAPISQIGKMEISATARQGNIYKWRPRKILKFRPLTALSSASPDLSSYSSLSQREVFTYLLIMTIITHYWVWGRKEWNDYTELKLVRRGTNGHLRLPCSTLWWFGQMHLGRVRCHVTRAPTRNQIFQLRYALERVPRTRDIETSVRFRWQRRSLSIWRGAMFDNFRAPVTMNVGRSLSSCIIHRPLPTYQVSSRSDEKIAPYGAGVISQIEFLRWRDKRTCTNDVREKFWNLSLPR